MRDLKYSEILASNRALGAELRGQIYRVALLSNIVITQLTELVEFSLRCRGINAEVTCGDYDNIVQDSMRLSDADAVLVFWEVGNLVEGLHVRADIMEPTALKLLAEQVQNEIQLVVDNLRHVPLVLFNRFSPLLFTSDDLCERPLDRLCKELNCRLNSIAAPNVLAIDIDRVFAKVGLQTAADFRQYNSSKALYTIAFFKAYVDHIEPAFLSVTGKCRKLLVLDCDNTLWGGVLGEDGETQIQMNEATRSGRIFREVQQIVKGLRQEGVMLALCSKNNPEDVDWVLSVHPDMVLRDSDFVAKKVNWWDKAANLRELASDLSIALDSFVFVDDSAFELGLVQSELPEVALVKVPDQLFEYPGLMRQLRRVFFVLHRTAEDERKTELYLEENARRQTAATYSSLEDYLKSLDLRVAVLHNYSVPVERAAQLTQKTNQFNLTTRRYTVGDISRFLGDDLHLVLAISVSDRFGDYGLTGLAILELIPDERGARLDVLLLSCRVLGRNVERVLFDYIVHYLSDHGVSRLRAEFLRTKKNTQVESLFDSLGFQLLSDAENCKVYSLNLQDYRQSGVDYIGVEVVANAV